MKSSRNMSGGFTQRQLRAGELVRRELAGLLERGVVHDSLLETLSVTVTEARVSPDLRHAVVYCLPLAAPGMQGETKSIRSKNKKRTPSVATPPIADVLHALNRCAPSLRGHLGRRLSMKYTPALVFKKDEAFDKAAYIDALLKQPNVVRDLKHSPVSQKTHKVDDRGHTSRGETDGPSA